MGHLPFHIASVCESTDVQGSAQTWFASSFSYSVPSSACLPHEGLFSQHCSTLR